MTHEALLLQALRQAPRRYRMPPLPSSAAQASASGPAALLAFSIERARESLQLGTEPGPDLRGLFTTAMAESIRAALHPEDGEPAFQAMVLRASTPEVDEYLQLSETARHDRRELRATLDTVAHPGKLRSLPADAQRDALAALHALATAGDWADLRQGIEQQLQQWLRQQPQKETSADATLRLALEALLAHPSLARLQRHAALAATNAVQRYEALRRSHGPAARSTAALQAGASAARRGASTEARTLQALHAVGECLDAMWPSPGSRYEAVGALLVPAAFTGVAAGVKGEWDAALVRRTAGSEGVELCLVAEAKASPDAADTDLPRLLRGLQRLAEAEPGSAHRFEGRGGAVAITGDSLRRLQPGPSGLPPQVFYCCDAPVQPQPPWLGAASRALLLAAPASLAFARSLLATGAPPDDGLDALWADLLASRRLRPVLHQWQTACAAREAMLHPDDLVAAVSALTTG